MRRTKSPARLPCRGNRCREVSTWRNQTAPFAPERRTRVASGRRSDSSGACGIFSAASISTLLPLQVSYSDVSKNSNRHRRASLRVSRSQGEHDKGLLWAPVSAPSPMMKSSPPMPNRPRPRYGVNIYPGRSSWLEQRLARICSAVETRSSIAQAKVLRYPDAAEHESLVSRITRDLRPLGCILWQPEK